MAGDGYYHEHDDVTLKGSPVKLDPVLLGHIGRTVLTLDLIGMDGLTRDGLA